MFKVTSSYEIASYLIQGLLEGYFKVKTSGEQEKNPLFVLG